MIGMQEWLYLTLTDSTTCLTKRQKNHMLRIEGCPNTCSLLQEIQQKSHVRTAELGMICQKIQLCQTVTHSAIYQAGYLSSICWSSSTGLSPAVSSKRSKKPKSCDNGIRSELGVTRHMIQLCLTGTHSTIYQAVYLSPSECHHPPVSHLQLPPGDPKKQSHVTTT